MSRRLEEQIIAFSVRLLGLEPPEVLDGVRQVLGELAALAGADRTHLMMPAPGHEPLVLSWIREGVPALWPTTDPEAIASFRWVQGHFERGVPVHVPRLADVPAEAVAEQREFERRGVRSLLGFPLTARGHVAGYLSLERVSEERGWSDDEIRLLHFLGEMLAGAVRRKQADDALRESEERFRALAEHATELISEFGPDGRYLYASPSFKDLLGYDPQALIGTPPQDLIHPEDLESSRAALVDAYLSQGYSRAVHRLRHTDGSWRWFDNTGRAFRTASGERRFVSIGRDITERKRMEEALAQQLGFERRIARLSQRLLDLGSAEIGDWIREGLASAAELVGADHAYLWSIEARPPYVGDAYHWLAEGVDPASATIPAGDGSRHRWAVDAVLRGQVIQLDSLADVPSEAEAERSALQQRGVRSVMGIPVRTGSVTSGFLGFECLKESHAWSSREIRQLRVFGDLFATALRRQRDEEALRESQVQLIQAQKMEAVGQLAGGIAHDFNNLLMVILGNAHMLIDRLGPDSEAREDANEIRAAAERAASLTRQLLTFSRRQILEPRSVDLNEVVGEAAEMLSRLLGKDFELVLACDPRIAPVWGDPGLLEQVLVNLGVNARDAMPGGGRLQVSTTAVRIGSREARRLGLARDGDYVMLAVRDDGTGMDDETLVRVFEPFFTTKEPGKGTGLGLSIVYNIVQRSGGAVQVESDLGTGTVFRLFLPCAPRSAFEIGPVPVPPRPAAEEVTETVLLVEDEDPVRRLVRNVLRRAGYRVFEASDGEEALALAAEIAEPVDLLLSDVVMPRMRGGELARRLQEQRPGLRVLLMSGYPAPGEAADESLPAAVSFLQKPFSDLGLLAKVREVIDAGESRPSGA